MANLDADSNRIYGALDESILLLIPLDVDGIQQQLFAVLQLNLRFVVAIYMLTREVHQRKTPR